MIKKNFSKVHHKGEFLDNGNAVLVIANHISWWDGFWIQYLNQKIIHRSLNFLMDEKQLKKYWYFRYTGGYSVIPGTKNIIDSLNYTLELLKNRKNLVLIFPQGKIHSIYQSEIHFKQGVKYILNRCCSDVQVLFVAQFIEFLDNPKPQLFTYFKSYNTEYLRKSDIEYEYNHFYTNALYEQKSITL